MWKHFLKDYFIFTRKERTGIIIIVAMILFLILISYAFPFFIKQKRYSHQQFDAEIARLTKETGDSSKIKNHLRNFDNEFYDDYSPSAGNKYASVKATVFYFDPNTISPGDWKRLGVKDKTISTIQHYLSKGGRFASPEDIAKIWGLSPADQQRLIPYVSIKSIPRELPSFEKRKFSEPGTAYPLKTNHLLDINLADTTGYMSLPGIGSKLSQRIIAFRNKLGGFYSVNQVGETYFLPDSVFQKIKPRLFIGDAAVRQININLASVDEMKAHPYLKYNLANAIFQYRSQHGKFNSIEDIKKIMMITGDIFNKIAPYLSLQ